MLKIVSRPLKFRLPGIASVCFLLAGCSHGVVTPNNTMKTQHPFQSLAAMDWRLSGIKRGMSRPVSRIAAGVPVDRYYLNFADGHMRLKGGCNSVNGSVKITGPGKMQVGPMVMTNRGCNTKLMRADSEIGRTLSYVTHYRLDERQLAMLGAKRILLFDGSPRPADASYSSNADGTGINFRQAKFW